MDYRISFPDGDIFLPEKLGNHGNSEKWYLAHFNLVKK